MSEPTTSFDLGDDDSVPENGVARELPPRQPKPEPSHRRKTPDVQRPPVRAQDPPRDFAEGHDPKHPNRGLSEKDLWPVKWLDLWNMVVEWVTTQTVGDRPATVEDVLIHPTRVSGGGQTGGADYDPIEGIEVAGSEDESPSVALHRVMMTRYHIPACVDERARATWKLQFSWRVGGKGPIKTSESFTLPSPAEIRRQKRARAAEHGPTIDTSEDVIDVDAAGQRKDYYHGRLEAELEALRRENEQARRENRAPRPVEQVQASVGAPQPADWQERIDLERRFAESEAARKIDAAEAVARAEREKREQSERFAAEKAEMQRKFDALEAKQREDALNARLRSLEERLANPIPQDAGSLRQQVLAELQSAGVIAVGPDGRPVPVASSPYTTPAVTPAQQILDAVKVAADVRAAEETTKKMLRDAFGFVDPRTEMVPHEEPEEKEEDTGLFSKMMKFVGANMDTILAGGSVVVAAAADSLLQPGAAAVVKGAVTAAQEQAARRQAGQTRTINPGANAAPRGKPPSA